MACGGEVGKGWGSALLGRSGRCVVTHLALQCNRLPESERATYDGYIGAESYAPLPIP